MLKYRIYNNELRRDVSKIKTSMLKYRIYNNELRRDVSKIKTSMLKCKTYNNELRRDVCKIKTSMLKSTISANIKSTMAKTAIEFWWKLYAIVKLPKQCQLLLLQKIDIRFHSRHSMIQRRCSSVWLDQHNANRNDRSHYHTILKYKIHRNNIDSDSTW